VNRSLAPSRPLDSPLAVAAQIDHQHREAGIVVLAASRVEGNVQLDLGGAIALRGLVVNGSIQLVANGGAIELDDNRVGSDIQLFENRGGA